MKLKILLEQLSSLCLHSSSVTAIHIWQIFTQTHTTICTDIQVQLVLVICSSYVLWRHQEHWIPKDRTVIPMGHTEVVSCQPPVTAFSSTSQCITLLYVCFCLKVFVYCLLLYLYVSYSVDSVTFNSIANSTINSFLNQAHLMHVFSPEGTSQPSGT